MSEFDVEGDSSVGPFAPFLSLFSLSHDLFPSTGER